jgi:hypothetical protein
MVNFTPWPLYPRGKKPGAHSTRHCLGLRTVLNVSEKTKISCISRESNLELFIRSPITTPSALPWPPRIIHMTATLSRVFVRCLCFYHHVNAIIMNYTSLGPFYGINLCPRVTTALLLLLLLLLAPLLLLLLTLILAFRDSLASSNGSFISLIK